MIKRIIYILAAGMVMAACDKAEIQDNSGNQASGTPFVEGQLVTLSVNAGDQTKVTSSYNTSDGIASFKWEAGDQIKVTVGDKSATFTLSNLIDGGTSAEFKGMMPASGSTFDVQYPTTAPDLTTQTYVENNLPEGKMLFAATNCTLGNSLTLSPQYAAVRFNFYGYDRKVTSIAVTNTTAYPNVTYTLNCTTPVKVGTTESNATAFLLALPTGKYDFNVLVSADEVIPNVDNTLHYVDNGDHGIGILITVGKFSTSSKTFSEGVIKNMAAKCITMVWAPVNCGYVPKTGDSGVALGYPYGKLYQWGRKDGQGYYKAGSGSYPTYEDATYPSGTNLATGPISNIPTSSDAEKFYKVKSYPNNWYSGSSPAVNDLWKEDGSSNYDPCPEGWRVPTMSELDKLAGGDGLGNAYLEDSGWDSTNKGYWFNGTESPSSGNGLFLPAAGYRYCVDCSADNRGSYGSYWSSSVKDNYAWSLYFSDYYGGMYDNYRAYGYSVRCVQE